MKKSRLLWGLWLVLTVVYWFFSDSYLAVFLPVASVLLPLLSAPVTRHGAKKLYAELSVRREGEKGERLEGLLTLRNQSLLPLDRVLIRGVCKNRLTGEKQVLRIRTAALPKTQTRQRFWVSSETCGVLQLTLSEAVVYDPFGLFCFRVPLQGEAETLVRPELYPSELSVLYGESMSLDSEEYSMKRAGFDPSETFAIREYRAGDGIRQIHWKLSEKLETLMVRDYGLPIQNTILLLLETGYAPGGEKPEPACISALAEGLLSVSESLGQMQLTHSIGWQDHEAGSFSCMEIDETEDRTLSMAGLLNAACGEDPESVLEHYLEGHEQMESAHVVLFTAEAIDEAAALAEHCMVTEVLCTPDGTGTSEQAGVSVCVSSPEQLAETISYLEI